MPEGRTVGGEISHLMRKGPSRGPQRGRRMGQRQAIAAAMEQARRGKIGTAREQRTARRGGR
jgi:hypothetical protein